MTELTTTNYCIVCSGDMPSGDRMSEGHVAVRFGDALQFDVLLDDVDVSRDCIEAVGGRPGWAILIDKMWCVSGHDHVFTYRQSGNVQVRSHPSR